MYNKKPPFEITNEILSAIAEIAELVGRFSATQGLSANPTLRRTNRIRTIYSSLAWPAQRLMSCGSEAIVPWNIMPTIPALPVSSTLCL